MMEKIRLRWCLILFLFSCILAFSACNRTAPENVTALTAATSAKISSSLPFKSSATLNTMFGINAYEWNFLQDQQRDQINEGNMSLIKTFGAVRHYLDWEKIEYSENNYSFNPAFDGSWDYDVMYQRCKQDNISVLVCLKTCPKWIVNTYPFNEQDIENVPAPYGLSRLDPASYIQQARAGFQFAARYGYNTQVNPSLVKVNSTPRWTNDPVNTVKIGLGLIQYIECDNERDKWWKGPQAQQSPEEYAANLSAFYDGNQGKLGKDVGVKTADPHMQVVMAGLASADPNYVARMIAWCKTNRGLKADGSTDLCFDIINYHYYCNNYSATKPQTHGSAPELTDAAKIADSFVALSKTLVKPLDVWVTENGYDINSNSPQGAIAIGKKSVLLTQADWLLRSAFLYKRHGINKLFYYQFSDDNPGSWSSYATAGLVDGTNRRPSSDYILQTSKLMGNYTYDKTISTDPLVDQYSFGNRHIYVLMVPDQKGRTASYQLDLGVAQSANIYNLQAGVSSAVKTVQKTQNGKLTINVTETPVFVQGVDTTKVRY